MNTIRKTFIFVIALLAFAQGIWAQSFITDVMIIAGNENQTNGYKTLYQNEGWTVINQDLNAGASGKFIYLLYKENSSSGSSGTAITNFYLKGGSSSDHPNTLTYGGHTYSLSPAVGANDLNSGAGGDFIFLYYTKEAFSPGRMVSSIYFNSTSAGAVGANGNTSTGYNLNNGAGGNNIYMHLITTPTEEYTDVYTESQLRDAVRINNVNIRMMADINIASEVVIDYNTTVTLDLNGHTLDRGLSIATNYGHVLKVISGSSLTINDASGNNSGVIKGGYTNEGGGINNLGTLVINGGTIRDNHTNTKGGGIINRGGAMLTINGGVITNNDAQDGGGIYNFANATLTVNGGSIEYNHATKYGGGGITNYGTLNITGGAVYHNSAVTNGGGVWSYGTLTFSGGTVNTNVSTLGGGLYINSGTATFSGGSITHNHATGNYDDHLTSSLGGGVYFNNGTLNLHDTPVIYGNSGYENFAPDNLSLASGKKITFTSPFTDGAQIGISMVYAAFRTPFTTGFAANNPGKEVYDVFSADSQLTTIELIEGEACLSQGCNYLNLTWNYNLEKVDTTLMTCDTYTVLTSNTSNSSTVLTDGWYVLDHSIEYKKSLHIAGYDVNIILCDGVRLNAKGGIYIQDGMKLTVYGQNEGTGQIYAHPGSGTGIGGKYNTVAGHFVVKGGTIDARAGSEYNAGIGGGNNQSGIRSISIYGGTIEAHGGEGGAGIGKGRFNDVREVITIYGGYVMAQGGKYGAGIGGGESRTNGIIEIWNGYVRGWGLTEAAGIGSGSGANQRNPITIHGGYVEAFGGRSGTGAEGGAGIGAGHNGDGGVITINGGTIVAHSTNSGAAIGGGSYGACGDITINDGDVTAYAYGSPGYGAGIGAGRDRSQGGTITINGGVVYAKAKFGAGIGGGFKGNGGVINITDGLVTVISREGAGIGGGGGPGGGGGGNGGTTTISGGVVIASSMQKGAGIGGGNDGNGGTVNILDGHVTATGGDYDFNYWKDHLEPNYLNFIKGFGGRDYHSSVIHFIANFIFSGSYGGAGIGGGDDGNGANVTISGGTVIASASNAYAIGRGDGGGSFGNLELYPDAKVQVKKGNDWEIQMGNNRYEKSQHSKYAIIEPCPHDDVSYLITPNGHFVSCNHCAHAHTEAHTIDPTTGKCVCGYGLATHTVTVYQVSASGNGAYSTGETYTVAHGYDFLLPANTDQFNNPVFEGWMVGTPNQVNGYEVIGGETLYGVGDAYNVTGDVSFIARFKTYWTGSGSGTGNDPFLITSTDDLNQLANRVNGGIDYNGKYFLQVNDIEFNGSENNFTAIGTNTRMFNGHFDGNHHSISGIHINQNKPFQGLFGAIGSEGTVEGVTLSNCSIKGSSYVGSIVGGNNGTVERCLALGCTVQGSNNGGVVGFNNGNLLFNYFTGDNSNGVGQDNHNASSVNVVGANKCYTISCAEGLTFDYVMGSVSGSDEDAVVRYDDTYYAAAGVSISMKVDSPLGYTITSLMYNGATIYPDGEGVYTFTMPASEVIITSTQTQPTFIHEGSWDDEENWSSGLPQGGCDVVIAAPAFLETSAAVGRVTFENGGSITIANGGELTHDNDVTATFQRHISAYNDDSDGWFTIASPTTYNVPVNNLITESEYDLYLYHEPTHYWWNSKGSEHGFNALKHLEGYLYANEEDVTLSFTGNMTSTNNTVTIPLSYNNSAGSLKGYNLVGNPFTRRLTEEDVIKIGDDDMTAYLVADGGGELVPYTLAERPIEPGEGFFVQASEPGQNLVINPATRGEQTKEQPAYIRIEVGKEGYYDRAYVQFDGGNTLRKMKFSDNTSNVSVWHNGEDWAVATIKSATSELPVNFKAMESGTYTISVSTENLEVDYLHLIDNLTGADIDLFQTSSYSFEAKVTDYDSRFRLVFRVDEGNQNDKDGFAFFSDGQLVVNGEGTLQVIDMLGHILLCREVHSDLQLLTSDFLPSGVYVIRLVNGDNVKTQKIVIQ